MEQVQTEYRESTDNIEKVQIIWSKYKQNRETGIWKVSEFNFLNEEVEKFLNRWSPNMVKVRSPSYLKQKSFQHCL